MDPKMMANMPSMLRNMAHKPEGASSLDGISKMVDM